MYPVRARDARACRRARGHGHRLVVGAFGLAALAAVGCLAESSIPIGRYEVSSTAEAVDTEGVVAPEDLPMSESGVHAPAPNTARDGSTCEAPAECFVGDPCQTASCGADRRCLVLLADEACTSGEECTLAGCRASALPCERRHGDALLFCDDFERGIGWNWSSVENVLLEREPADRESVVARARITPDTPRSMLQLQLPVPIDAGTLAMRSWVYVAPGTEVDEAATIYASTQLPATGDPVLSLELRPNSGLASTDRLGAETFSFAPALVPGQWHCLEWQIVVHDREGSITVLVDELPIIQSSLVATRPSAGLSLLGVGLSGGSGETIDVSFDDVVFATAPIGCA